MKFSIFLPVRNGGSYLRQCVTSILEQTYPEYQLVILDNASSDGTSEWISGLRDARVVHLKSEGPLSIQESWRRVLQYGPKNEFMTIIGHDDLLDRHYLDTVRSLIGERPDAGLYQTHFRLIDSNGDLLRPCRVMPERETSAGFLESRMLFKRDSYGTGYVFRHSDYERVGGIPGYEKLLFADDALWMKLMQGSWKATSRESCFAYRVHSGSTSFSPDPYSVYEALDSYLAFLQDACIEDADVSDVVRRRLASYLTKIYQSGYFQLRRNPDQFRSIGAAIRDRIERSARRAGQTLGEVDGRQGTDFPEMVRRHVFGSPSYYYWTVRARLHGLRLKFGSAHNALR